MPRTAPRLVLVRHAEVALRPDVPATAWELTAAGHAAARLLAERPELDSVAAVASSPEPKALATAAPVAARAGVEVVVDPDLREAERPDLPILPRAEHEELVARYLSGEALDGWEPVADVRARMREALRRIPAEAGDAVAVSHGRALAILLGLSPREWAAIPLPALAVADAGTLRLQGPFS